MAISKEFTDTIQGIKGLKANKDYTRFFYRFKVEGREFTKIFDYSKKTWTKNDRKKNAIQESINFKDSKENNDTAFTFDTKFEYLAKEYMANKCTPNTKWTNEKITMLDHYIYPHLKIKNVSSIKERDIDKIRISMETSGHGVQNKNGCSPRTIRKVLLQVLKPILEYGHRNGAINRIPEIDVPSKPKKKSVKDGTEKLTLLYKTIHTLYKDNPFYRGLFLFAFFGRRWNEIRTLEWTDINFSKGEYTIRAENSKIDEDKTFVLPKDIIEALNNFEDSKGLVFTSPKTGRELTLPKKQMEKLREASGIEGLTLHYFRHIMATALSDSGMVGTVLSASLGHNNSQTVDNYYRTANHLKGSKEATLAMEHILDAEVSDE